MGTSKPNLILAVLVVALSAVSIGLLVVYLQAIKAATDDADDADNADLTAEGNNRSASSTGSEVASTTTRVPVFAWERSARLPKTVLPRHYDLYLHPDLQTGLFSGRVEIHLDSQEERDHFLVHSKHLNITSTKLSRVQNATTNATATLREDVAVSSAFEYPPNEFHVVRSADALSAGSYILSLEFRGSLTNGIVGFYRSVYTAPDGESVPMATSKFQPTYARRAFPCLDEPAFKATFAVTLVRPSSKYLALSNMPAAEEVEDAPAEGLTEVRFETSVPMVTYLTCFVVCDFAWEEKLSAGHRTKVRVYANPAQKDRVRYALDVGANITDYFQDYFQVPYPLPKQDLIAIPDFVSGAMEHWGLITFRESSLLYDTRESSSGNKQRVATVVSHELAHQWFGNLVTLSWWDDLWLNEGFASYLEYKGVDNYHADWAVEDQFLTRDLHPVMDLDATANSHPIVQPVDHPDQITEIFDVISYSKGAAVLRMLEDFMGAEEFRTGVTGFLRKFQYGNAVTDDLWSELSNASTKNLNISDIMDTWTRQMGLPLLTVERDSGGRYKVSQERYLLDPNATSDATLSPYGYKWDIPVTWVTSLDPKSVQQKWLSSAEVSTDVPVPADAKWVKFNVGQTGYYRVRYPTEDWAAFSTLLKENHEILSATDRASLINDAFSLAESGHLSYSAPLAMVQYLKNEKSYVPWETAMSKLNKVEGLLRESAAYPLFRQYMLSLVEEHYGELGWSDVGSHAEKLNRVNVLTLACRNGHAGCLRQAGRLFKAWVEEDTYLAPNLRGLVYRFGMQADGDAERWQVMLERYMRESNAQEKRKLLFGLAFVNQPWVLSQFLRLAKNETIVRSQDYFTALQFIAQNPIGTSMTWDFLRSEWPYLVSRFTLNDRYLGKLPLIVTSEFATQFHLDQTREFFAKYPEAGAGARSRKQAVEAIQNNIAWLGRHREEVYRWLVENPTQ